MTEQVTIVLALQLLGWEAATSEALLAEGFTFCVDLEQPEGWWTA